MVRFVGDDPLENFVEIVDRLLASGFHCHFTYFVLQCGWKTEVLTRATSVLHPCFVRGILLPRSFYARYPLVTGVRDKEITVEL